MREYSFEKLEVWQLSRKLVKLTYEITSTFPNEEKFGIVSQMRRATISVSSNISEGSSRKSFKDQARFTVMAYSSLMELLNQFILSNDLDWLSSEKLILVRELIDEISNKLNALRNYQISKIP